MPTKIMKEVWVANDGSEHDSATTAVRYEQRQQLIEIFIDDEHYPDDANNSAITILTYADNIVRILTTTIPE